PAVAAISFCLIGGTVPAVADIIHVPGDYLTIQEAIDAAMDGDEVEVHPGTYNETIDFLGKAITVYSTDGRDVTIIDAQQTGTVVTCNSGEGPDTVLDGFTVTGGTGSGMASVGSSPRVTNCTFSGNFASFSGGMYNSDSSPTVTSCIFSGNTALPRLGGGGGDGGGMFNDNDSSPTMANCTFSGNLAFAGNGGAMFNGGGSPTVTNCILWGDSSSEIEGPATVSYSDVAGGFAGLGNIDADPMFVDPINSDYRPSTGSPSIDAGNNWGVPIDADDYDQDGNTAELFPVDLDGNPRFNADEADFDPGCGVPVVVDMGAYEYQFAPVEEVIFADLNADGVVGILDLLGVLAAWGDAKNNCLADLDIDGDVGILDLLTLLSNWG
ncbi:MAG: hypothetical protein O7C65_02755, partial [Planctomycetota bacterium]|nr:hypothetical protein [Planctomycetota bacterium]